jgi:hypothetical protein
MRHRFNRKRCAICRIAFREGDYIDYIDWESGYGHAGCVLLAKLNLIYGWRTTYNDGKPDWKAVTPEATHFNKNMSKDPLFQWSSNHEKVERKRASVMFADLRKWAKKRGMPEELIAMLPKEED